MLTLKQRFVCISFAAASRLSSNKAYALNAWMAATLVLKDMNLNGEPVASQQLLLR